MFVFVGIPLEQRAPVARVPQYVLIGAPTIPSCSLVVPSLAAPESEPRPLALVATRYRVRRLATCIQQMY